MYFQPLVSSGSQPSSVSVSIRDYVLPGSSAFGNVIADLYRRSGFDYGFDVVPYNLDFFNSLNTQYAAIGFDVPFVIQVPVPEKKSSFSFSFDPVASIYTGGNVSVSGTVPENGYRRVFGFNLYSVDPYFKSAIVTVTYSDGSSDTVTFTDSELLSASFTAPSSEGQSYIDLSGQALNFSGLNISSSDVGLTGDLSYSLTDVDIDAVSFYQQRNPYNSAYIQNVGYVDYYRNTGIIGGSGSLSGTAVMATNTSLYVANAAAGAIVQTADPIPVQHSAGTQLYIQSISISGILSVLPSSIYFSDGPFSLSDYFKFQRDNLQFSVFLDSVSDVQPNIQDHFGLVLNYGLSVGFSQEDFLAQISSSLRTLPDVISSIPSLIRSALVPTAEEVKEAVTDQIDDLIQNNPTVGEINSTIQQIDNYEKQFVNALSDRSEAVITFFPMSFNMPDQGVIQLSKPYVLTSDLFDNAVFNAGKSVLNTVVVIFTAIGFLSFIYNFVLAWIANQPYIEFLKGHYSLDSTDQEDEH